MKTLKIAALAALGLALPAVAESTGICSANIVGYQIKELESGNFTMFGNPFLHVNEDKAHPKGLMLNQDLTFSNATAGEDVGLADQLWVWDHLNGYYITFFNYAGPDADAGWRFSRGNQELAEELYPDGLADNAVLYYKAKASEAKKSVTGAGAVDTDSDARDYLLVPGNYTMAVNPYPVATKLNDATSVTFQDAVGNDECDSADQIWLWNKESSDYEMFFLSTDGWRLTTGEQPLFETIYPDGIPSGTAFFYYAKAGADRYVSFKNPIK